MPLINYVSLIDKIYIWTTYEHTSSMIYLYARRLKRSTSSMLGNILALMILVKSKGNWTVRCMCTLSFKCSCTCIFTCFVDLVLTCVLALTIICFHVYWLIWSHAFTFTSYEIHILLCTHTLLIIHFFVPCFDNCMLLCQHAFTRTSSLSYMP